MPNQIDHIVIAGAGPAGSTLAIRLRKIGIAVTLIERHKFPRQKLCGEFISPECLNHFEELDVLDEMLEAGGDRIYETVFYETGGRSTSVPSHWFDSDGAALSLSRARMDEILLNAAKSAGANVLEEAAVTGLLTKNGTVAGVKIRFNSGETQEIQASITIDATGRAKVLSRLANKDHARGEPKPRFVGFKAHFAGVEMERGVCEMYAMRDGYAGLSFVENGQANLCFLARASLLSNKNDADAILNDLIRQNARARVTLSSAGKVHDWLAVSVPSFGLSQFPQIDGLFTVGDSAAFVDPFTGSGMLLAIESAAAFAECIAAVGLDKNALRDSYQTVYKSRFAQRLKVSSLIRYVAYTPILSTIAVLMLSTSRRLRESLARRTRSAR